MVLVQRAPRAEKELWHIVPAPSCGAARAHQRQRHPTTLELASASTAVATPPPPRPHEASRPGECGLWAATLAMSAGQSLQGQRVPPNFASASSLLEMALMVPLDSAPAPVLKRKIETSTVRLLPWTPLCGTASSVARLEAEMTAEEWVAASVAALAACPSAQLGAMNLSLMIVSSKLVKHLLIEDCATLPPPSRYDQRLLGTQTSLRVLLPFLLENSPSSLRRPTDRPSLLGVPCAAPASCTTAPRPSPSNGKSSHDDTRSTPSAQRKGARPCQAPGARPANPTMVGSGATEPAWCCTPACAAHIASCSKSCTGRSARCLLEQGCLVFCAEAARKGDPQLQRGFPGAANTHRRRNRCPKRWRQSASEFAQ